MTDYIINATAADGQVRAFAASTKQITETARTTHNTTPTATAALGRTLTAAVIMGSMLKDEGDIITIQIRGDGPIGGITVVGDSALRVKGYVHNPDADLPLKPNGKLDVSGVIGKGTLSVIKDIGLKDPYCGQVELTSGEIAQDITYYYAQSEQIPTVMALGVLVDVDYTVRQSGGFLIQLMPGASEDTIQMIEDKIENLDSITSMLDIGMSPEDVLEKILGGLGLVIGERTPCSFTCNCSRERVEKALIGIGRDEMEDILATDKKATLHCHFCNKDYEFDEAQIRELLDQ